MKNIDLFNKEKQQGQENVGRIDEKRPQKLNLSKVVSQNLKWSQCKVIGKNISIRSYSAGCVFDNKLWIYGGYQILNGLLNDFYCIDLSEDRQMFTWEQVLPKEKNKPGKRGGLYTDIKSSNQVFRFDPKQRIWQLLIPSGQQLPALDSFGCTLAQKDGCEMIVIGCGCIGESIEYSNTFYLYSISQNKMSKIFEGGNQKSNKNYPIARSGCAMASMEQKVYLFGGKDDERRMRDFWELDLKGGKLRAMGEEGAPAERNGHSLSAWGGKVYLFGGIHDITWQLDDLHIFSVERGEWSTLEQDSARKVEKKREVKDERREVKDERSPKKNWYDTSNSLYGNRSISPLLKNNSSNDQDHNRSLSPGKLLDQQKKKAFYHKKNQMLKEFNLDERQSQTYIAMETSSQAMKNSLHAIGNPNATLQPRITDFGKHSESKFLGPLQNHTSLIRGKKPCARDGHCAVVIDSQLIIFGGDRHQMSFNDIYKLNLKLIKPQISN